MREEAGRETPGIATAFTVFGWILAIVGALVVVVALNTHEPDATEVGLGMVASSLMLFGLAAIISRLHQIEINTRPPISS